MSPTTSSSSCAASDVKAPAVLAFDLGGTRLKAGLVVGERVEQLVTPFLERTDDAGAVVAQMAAVGRALAGGRSLLAVGAAVKGIVSAASGRVLEVNEPLRALSGFDLGAELGRAFGVPIAVENDARLFAYGELAHGAGRGVRNLVGVTLGTGVGVGVVRDGALLAGSLGILGGHLTVDLDGPRCNCGNVGCVEAFIGTADFNRALAAGIVNWVHAYDPELVVIGGGRSRSAELRIGEVSAYVSEHAWTVPRGRVRVELSALGDEAALLGAAALATAARAHPLD